MTSESSARRALGVRALTVAGLSALCVVLALVIVRSAWVADDAFITFRTIDNALHGFGLRWNVAERVQSYTHPLWLMVLLPIVRLTGNPYVSAIGASLALTAVAVGIILTRWRASWGRLLFVLVVMSLSKAFTEYSTSGLENALSHALVAAVMLVTVTPLADRRRALLGGALVGLVGLTRLDLLVLAGPIAAFALRSPRRTLPAFACGLLPLAAWEIFSVIYYGVPFPNTAYAKLATGIPSHEMTLQGVVYLLDSLKRDPVTLFAIGAGVSGAFSAGRAQAMPALAVLLYLVYVVRIGGDFMSGRFLTAPLVAALCLPEATTVRTSLIARLAPVAVAAAFGLAVPRPTIFVNSTYYTPLSDTVYSPSGVTDERGESSSVPDG